MLPPPHPALTLVASLPHRAPAVPLGLRGDVELGPVSAGPVVSPRAAASSEAGRCWVGAGPADRSLCCWRRMPRRALPVREVP